MVENGWVKIHRKVKSCWWYTEPTTSRLLLHMLLSANYERKEWNGITIPRGSMVSSIRSLSDETGLTERQIRTALKHLEDRKEIIKQTTHKYTIFKIVNYNLYLGDTVNDTVNDTQNDTVNNTPSHTQNDTVNDVKKSPILAVCSDCKTDKRHSKQHTENSSNDTQNDTVNDTQNDNNERNIKRNIKNIMIDDVRDRFDTSDFCAAVEKAYTKLTGNNVNDDDMERIAKLSLCGVDSERVILVMLKVAERKEGEKINSFNYFMREIEKYLKMSAAREKPPSKNDLDGRYPETSTTEDTNKALNDETNALLSRTSSGVYNYDD